VSAPPLRWIDDGELEPSFNMALDDALLQRADLPTLRLYGWQPRAVSLGWFQRCSDFAELTDSIELTRRLTGGGAIHHDHELTYSLAIDAAMLPSSVDGSYALLHDAVVDALTEVGCRCRRLEHGHAPQARPRDRWCFADPGRNDIVDPRGRKLVGSAQRRIQIDGRPRVLHHGSIVLSRPSLTPFGAAVDEQCGDASVEVALRHALVRRVSSALRIPPDAGQPLDDEMALARCLQRDRYLDPSHLNAR
jgi:lipoate-protein ligase A